MPNALITEAAARVSDVVAVLECGRFEPVRADSSSELVDLCASVLSKSLASYAHLPDDHPARASALAETSVMVAAGAVTRHHAVPTDAPRRAETATVLLVMGDPVTDSRRSDPAGHGHGGDRERPDSSYVDLVSAYVDFEPGLGFADWRHDMLSLPASPP